MEEDYYSDPYHYDNEDHSMDNAYESHAAFECVESELYGRIHDIYNASTNDKKQLLDQFAEELSHKFAGLFDYVYIKERIYAEYENLYGKV